MKNLLSLFALCFFLFAGWAGKAQDKNEFANFSVLGVATLTAHGDFVEFNPASATHFTYTFLGSTSKFEIMSLDRKKGSDGKDITLTWKLISETQTGTVVFDENEGVTLKLRDMSSPMKFGKKVTLQDDDKKEKLYVAFFSKTEIGFYIENVAKGSGEDWMIAPESDRFSLDIVQKAVEQKQDTHYVIEPSLNVNNTKADIYLNQDIKLVRNGKTTIFKLIEL